MVHSSQIIDGNDVRIRWSPDGLVSTFLPLETFQEYSLDLQWSEKIIIPVGRETEESAKISISGNLNLSAIVNLSFRMPEIVWIEIGLKLLDLSNGDRWQLNRIGKFRVISESEGVRANDTIERRYQLKSQGAISYYRALIPASQQVYFVAPYKAEVQISTQFGASELSIVL